MITQSIRSTFSLLVLTLAVLLIVPPAQAKSPPADVTIIPATNPTTASLLIDINSNMAAPYSLGVQAQDGAPILALLLIGAGLIVFLFFVGLMAYVIFFYYKKLQPTRAMPAPVPTPTPPPPTIVEDRSGIGPRRQEEIPTLKAKLEVVEGHAFMSKPAFDLDKSEIEIGRNLDIAIRIKDKSVSRSHAKIIYRDHGFFIQDLASTAGTKVNGREINAHEDVRLENKAVIEIGATAKFRFESIDFDPGETVLDSGIDFDPGETVLDNGIDFDPDKTVFDNEIDFDPDKTIFDNEVDSDILPSRASSADPRMTLDISWDEFQADEDEKKKDQ